jgi:hypothetical protein
MAKACLLLMALLVLPMSSAVADTEASGISDVSVLVEPFVCLSGLAYEITATVAQNRASSTSLTVRIYDQFQICTNSDVMVNGWVTGTLGTAGSLDLDTSDCADAGVAATPDTLGPVVVALKDAPFGEAGAYVVAPVRGTWVNGNGTETGTDECCGQDWVVQCNIDRDGLCDHAGLYTGTLTLTVDTVACDDN